MALVSVVTGAGNGYCYVDQYIVYPDGNYQYSRTLNPTWDTSSRDRTQDVLDWINANGFQVLDVSVYNAYQSFFDSNGGKWPAGKWYVGNLGDYIRDVVLGNGGGNGGGTADSTVTTLLLIGGAVALYFILGNKK